MAQASIKNLVMLELLFSRHRLEFQLFIVFAVTGVILVVAEALPPLSLFSAAVFFISLIGYRHSKTPVVNFLFWILAIIAGLFIGLYRPEGFNFPVVFTADNFGIDSQAYTLFINTGKALAGYIALFLLVEKFYFRLSNLIWIPLFATTIITFAIFQLELSWQPKPIALIIQFAMVNLLITCVAEEVFMRRLFQKQLIHWMKTRTASTFFQEWVPIAIVTLIFSLTHITHSWEATTVYVLAGFLYALCYSLTKNLYVCIALHFLVNLTHFSLFTYPV